MAEKWQSLFDGSPDCSLEGIRNKIAGKCGAYGIYERSVQNAKDTVFFIARQERKKALVIVGALGARFTGEEMDLGGIRVKVCRLTHHNCVQLRALFAYINPVSHGNRKFSMGLGDRLGVASAGHIRAVAGLDIFPVMAQQSIRELNLTGRDFASVLDDVCWAVFQEGYTDGFGADADHLKTREEVRMGVESGFTMVTLDCSEHIGNRFFDMDETHLRLNYGALAPERRREIENRYLSGKISIDPQTQIAFSRAELMRCALVYEGALAFIGEIYREFFSGDARKMDFEVSIDETTVPTSPEAHYYIALELKNMGVRADSLAPRFCGEFQKGIDYIGNARDFEREFAAHAKIAEHFGYRLSIHSGSDKFGVFPTIGKLTGLNVHVKTAGTNWLEAVRLIARKNPSLYRRMHQFAIENLEAAKKYYHIKADIRNIPDIDMMDDENLPAFLDRDDSRQALHITYGLLLQQKDERGGFIFRDELYATLYRYEEDYYEHLKKHIGRHISALGAG